jgi:uncharacterized membrane protein YgcG
MGGVGLVALAWVGCSDDAPVDPTGTGGQATTSTSVSASVSTAISTTTGTLDPCSGGAPDGVCEPSFEDCSCSDCVPTGMCTPGACVANDGGCSLLDSCTCPECDLDYYCGDPADYNCTDDGVCDHYYEGCGCADCWAETNCTDNVAACSDGAADGLCDLAKESCDCVDCLGTVDCVPCIDDGACNYVESCLCPDCATDSYCTDPGNCANEGICAPLYEGCHCIDCATEDQCTGGGTGGSGGAGGAGGAGGSGGGGAGGS